MAAQPGSPLPWSRGQYRQALTLSEQTLAGLRRVLGEDHPATLQSMNNLAETRRALGDLDGARQLHGKPSPAADEC